MRNTVRRTQPGQNLERSGVLSRLRIFILIIGISTSVSAAVLTNGTPYQIKCVASQRVLDVKGGSTAPGAQVWQYDRTLSDAQQFTFVDAGNGLYNIFTNSKLLLTLKTNLLLSDGGGASNSNPDVLIQAKKYMGSAIAAAAVNGPDPKRQQWKLIPVGSDGFTYIIQNAWAQDKVMQPFSSESQSGIVFVSNTGADNQKWLITEPHDLMESPLAAQSEIDEFNNIRDNQYGVGVLGGEATKPFYYHHNKPDEMVYKYKKIVDTKYFSGYALDAIAQKLGPFGGAILALEVVDDLVRLVTGVAKDIFNYFSPANISTLKAVDSWYPDSDTKTTVCGIMEADGHYCGQDYMHTKVIVDKDVCLELVPNEKFKPMLRNRWAGDAFTAIEGEVKATNLQNYNNHTKKTTETITPKNPFLKEHAIKKGDRVGLFGPWMADILDINAKVGVPFTNNKFELANIDIRNNNEIHPINQMWVIRGEEIQLTSVVDKTGYFNKHNDAEVEASGFNQRMRYYLAFEIPSNLTSTNYLEYHVNGMGYDFTPNLISNVKANVITFKYKGQVCLKINDNSFLRLHKTHTVFLEKTRKRSDGSLQGYIVVETEPIIMHGGSINVFVKKVR